MYGRESNPNRLRVYNAHALHNIFLQVPYNNATIFSGSSQQAVSTRGSRTYELFMAFANVPDDHILAILVSLINHDPAVDWAAYQQRVLFQENYFNYLLIFVI